MLPGIALCVLREGSCRVVVQFLQGFARAACENPTRDGTECAMDAYAYAMQSIYLAETSLLGVRAASTVNRIPSGRSVSYYDRRKTQLLEIRLLPKISFNA